MMDPVDELIALSTDGGSGKDLVRVYQGLVNSGRVWTMGPKYTGPAIELIESGLVLRHQN